MALKGEKRPVRKLKPLKDVDSPERTLRLKLCLWAIPPLGLLGFVYGGVKGLLLGVAGGIIVAYLTVFISGRLSGGAVNTFYGMRKGRWSLHERLEGPMNIARNQKRHREFDKALATVDQILAQAPEYTEAIFLKAQILWEGFHSAAEAKACLQQVMLKEPDQTATLYRWAASLYREITLNQVPPYK